MDDGTAGGVQSVERALKLIEYLSEEPSGKRLLLLADETKLAPSTVHRMLQTLVSAGYVSQDVDGGSYRLTGKLLDVASKGVVGRTLRQESLPHLKKLRDLTGESSHLVVLDNNHTLTVESILSNERNLIDCKVGERAPLHCTAVGKCLIAYLPQESLEDLITHLELTRFTEHTICTISDLRKNLAVTREQGYAVDWEENELGVRCIASPVQDASGDVVAALGISGPSTRITDEAKAALAAQVCDAARDVSLATGYSGS